MSSHLQGEVISLVFTNPESQYTVARIKADSEPGQITIVGQIGQLVPGEKVLLEGEWKEHPKFGRQFQVYSCDRSVPATINGIQRYLGSGMIKGIGPIMAENLIQAFGSSVLDILDKEPDKLLKVEGIGPKKLERIKKSWQEQREIRSLILFLQTYEVPTTYVGKIFQRYGTQAIQKLKENPYDLAYEIRGIGFKTADKMALKLGIKPDSPQRLEAVLVYALFQMSDQGHIFSPKEELFQSVLKIIDNVNQEDLEKALSQLQEKKKVQVHDLPQQDIKQAVFLRHFYRWEGEISTRLVALLTHPAIHSGEKIRQHLGQQEKEFKISLSSEQRKAVFTACNNKVCIITGGPGTGKTTITKFIYYALKRLNLKVKLAAPTGRASKRLAEATGSKAHTIHRLLGYNPGGEFTYNEDKKLNADVLIIDEISMLDCQLCVHLLRALPLTCRLIFIGDVNQLPSVGPGNILYDLLNSETIPYVVLTQIYRQARESMLVVNAHQINQGFFPKPCKKKAPEADFFWVEQDDVERVQNLMLHMVCNRIPDTYGLDPLKEVQVLSPMHKGPVGNNELNRLLQQRLNKSNIYIKSGSSIFRSGDRILQVRNNYEKGVFNGDLGWIRGIDLEGGEIRVDFDGEIVVYDQTELDELTLAYSISVHKAQGSEYPAIVVPVVNQHYMLLQRNLIYTAITRAKKLAILIGNKKALAMGIKNKGLIKRYTNLLYRLRDSFYELQKA